MNWCVMSRSYAPREVVGYVIAERNSAKLRAEQAEARLAAIDATPSADIGLYDAGLMSSYGGGDVQWWRDYMRAELGRAHDFYTEQASKLIARPAKESK